MKPRAACHAVAPLFAFASASRGRFHLLAADRARIQFRRTRDGPDHRVVGANDAFFDQIADSLIECDLVSIARSPGTALVKQLGQRFARYERLPRPIRQRATKSPPGCRLRAIANNSLMVTWVLAIDSYARAMLGGRRPVGRQIAALSPSCGASTTAWAAPKALRSRRSQTLTGLLRSALALALSTEPSQSPPTLIRQRVLP